uniref:phosphoglycerate mutase (2,3-diphosphoglycerate-independent) n=1 Tax=Heterorhabditis bacteriophora TaxID=37862 RepID=A0A1I7W8U5_HETBA
MAGNQEVKNPVCLVVIDGWGLSDDPYGNAILNSNTPACCHFPVFLISKLFYRYFLGNWTQIEAHGLHVGLPEGLMGNSEVGHLNIGAGRPIYQDIVRINLSVKNNSMVINEALVAACERAKVKTGRIHLAGLVSDGGVHSHINHMFALLKAIKELQVPNCFLHFYGDGRDTSPTSGAGFLDISCRSGYVLNKINQFNIVLIKLIRLWAWSGIRTATRRFLIQEICKYYNFYYVVFIICTYAHKLLFSGYILMVTADHGNAEKMKALDGSKHTAHTCNRVPFTCSSDKFLFKKLLDRAPALCDVAPTVLDIMGLPQPAEMTGVSLVEKDHSMDPPLRNSLWCPTFQIGTLCPGSYLLLVKHEYENRLSRLLRECLCLLGGSHTYSSIASIMHYPSCCISIAATSVQIEPEILSRNPNGTPRNEQGHLSLALSLL